MATHESRAESNSWPDFLEYVLAADIKFVQASYLADLFQGGRVLPRRQEAEGEPGALFQPDQTTQHFKYIAISHCWESREHPDPYGHQLEQIVSAIGQENLLSGRVVFFIDYTCLSQFKRSDEQETSFQSSMKNLQLLYANSGSSFCEGVWTISRLTPWWWRLCRRTQAIPIYYNAAGAMQFKKCH